MNVEKENTNTYRYERKFFISELFRYEIEALIKLHPAMFSEIYYQRFVNNIYFDTLNMKNYFDNIDGSKDRIKVRIRWYDDLFGVIEKPVLEFKIKKGLVGRKESYPLVPFSLDENFQHTTIVAAMNSSKISDFLKLDLISLKVLLLNRYKRKYFLSANRKYRITIDSEMEYYKINPHNNTFLHKSVDVVNTIIELKYNQDDDKNIHLITSQFPFRLTKSSKYLSGIEQLYL